MEPVVAVCNNAIPGKVNASYEESVTNNCDDSKGDIEERMKTVKGSLDALSDAILAHALVEFHHTASLYSATELEPKTKVCLAIFAATTNVILD